MTEKEVFSSENVIPNVATEGKKSANVPNLRFPEFKIKWDNSTIGRNFEILMCKRIFSNQTTPIGDVPFYKIGTIGAEADAFIKQELYEEYKNKYNFPCVGEVLVSCSGTIGKCFRYNGKPAYYQDSNIVWLSNKHQLIDNDFIYWIICRTNWNFLSSTTITRLYGDDLRNVKFSYPSIEEQRKITTFLALIDERIDTQSKIIEDIKLQKKSIIDRLFCDIGLFPNGREVKLREILQEGSKIPVDTTQYKKITIKLHLGGLEYTEQGRSMKDTRPFYVRHKGELIIGKQNYFNGSIALIEDEFDGCICSNAIMSFAIAPSVNSIFLFHAISNADFLKMRAYYANGTGQKELSEKDFLNFCIKLPTLEEQIKVAKILLGLEKKIEIEKDILTAYKRQKAYLLREMFI